MFRKLSIPKFENSPVKRFVYTYKRILAIAYKVNKKSLVLVTILNSLWGLTNLPSLYINKILIDIVIANIGKPDVSAGIRMIVILILGRALVEFLRAAISRFNGN